MGFQTVLAMNLKIIASLLQLCFVWLCKLLQLLALLYLLMPPFLRLQSRSEVILSLGAGEWSLLCFRSAS